MEGLCVPHLRLSVLPPWRDRSSEPRRRVQGLISSSRPTEKKGKTLTSGHTRTDTGRSNTKDWGWGNLPRDRG